ncbi:hypothetical protein CPS_1659 [Colwellia psychrerythraea 34H]|uniref:Uncharacterized protein n=1 Tax=Colwellia psychrerythraea (strain 34H / ATCC BAA-681) TaxID=167879 RepID=Q484W8_COLP3|nr:hypothetical protein CPS_1659 [Colwellia psychrerythraea 34H]
MITYLQMSNTLTNKEATTMPKIFIFKYKKL